MSEFYLESKKYFEDRYNGDDWVKHISFDNEDDRSNKLGEIYYPFEIEPEQLTKVENKYGISPNGFFITALILTTAIYEQKPNILTSWIHKGRNDVNELSTVGLLYRDLPVGVKLQKDMTIKSLFEDIIEQINTGIEYSCYPFVESNNQVVTGDYECLLYQDNIRNMVDLPGILGEVELENEYEASQNVMDIEILNDMEHGLILGMEYNSSLFNEDSASRMTKIFVTAANVLLALSYRDDLKIKKLIRIISRKADEGGLFSENWWLKWMN